MRRFLPLILVLGCQPVTTAPATRPTIPGVTVEEPTDMDTARPPTTPVPPSPDGDAQAVLTLVNQARGQQGLSPLALNQKLQTMAENMGNLMFESGQMSHGLGGGFQNRLNRSGYKYRSAGENIAQGQRTPADVMAAWMASPGHRANILGNYRDIGISHVGQFWCTDFGLPATGAAEARARVGAAEVNHDASSIRLEPDVPVYDQTERDWEEGRQR